MNELERARALFGQGLERFAVADYAGAEEKFLAAADLAPDRISILANLCTCLILQEKWSEAKPRAMKALHIAPDDFQANMNLGACLRQEGAHDKALACFEKACSIDAKSAPAWAAHGIALTELAHHDKALASYDGALACDPMIFEALTNRGRSCHELKRYGDALKSYDAALAVQPRHIDTLIRKAMTLHQLKRYEEALAISADVVATQPAGAAGWLVHGRTLFDLQRHQEAMHAYDEAIRLKPIWPDAWSSRASAILLDVHHPERGLKASAESLDVYLNSEFAAHLADPEGCALFRRGVHRLRLQHDIEQARYLLSHSYRPDGIDAFIEAAESLMNTGDALIVHPDLRQMKAMLPYLAARVVYEMPQLPRGCLNPDNDWDEIERSYLQGNPQSVVIDNFLTREGLAALREYCLVSKVWLKEYSRYVGAFAYRGFSSPVHLQLARELQEAMPRVFADLQLTQLWGFKYHPGASQGINAHADFAKVNLNFWITPDEFNVEPECGGLRVWDVASPTDWTFADYNDNPPKIHEFLKQHNASIRVTPHRCNRALLFNSALFHETDRIHFKPGYESHRINMTYLFGSQL